MELHKKWTATDWMRLILSIYLGIATILHSLGHQWLMFYYALQALVLVLVASFFQKQLGQFLSVLLMVMITIGAYGGNRYMMYYNHWWYDMTLHFASGIVIALFWAQLVYPIDNGTRKLAPWRVNTPRFMVVCTSIIFAMACACGWEIFEFIWDIFTGNDNQWNLRALPELFGRDWQNPGIRDTMNDIIDGTAGGLVGAGINAFMRRTKKVRSVKPI